MFAACAEAFDRGWLVAIYPEGATRAEARVQRSKTGASRIALGYEAHAPGRLTVVPVGLSVDARRRFRGRVLVAFGEPVGVSSPLAVYREEPAKALHALTTAIQGAMEREVDPARILPYYLPGWLAGRMSRRPTDYATIRLLASVVAFPLLWAAETCLVGWAAGPWWALAFFLSLPLGGLIAYRYLVGTGRLRHQLRFGALLLTRAQEARRLLAERGEIVEELERAGRDYRRAAKRPRARAGPHRGRTRRNDPRLASSRVNR
jgi:hypothetical protein